MKRDLDLMRKLLLALETREEECFASELKIANYDGGRIQYHVRLLAQGGYVVGSDQSTMDGNDFLVESLTFSGHEYLDAVRSPKIWRMTKEAAVKVGGSLSMEAVKPLASAILRQLTEAL